MKLKEIKQILPLSYCIIEQVVGVTMEIYKVVNLPDVTSNFKNLPYWIKDAQVTTIHAVENNVFVFIVGGGR